MAVFRLYIITFSLSMASSWPGLNVIGSQRPDSALLDEADTDVVGPAPVTVLDIIIYNNNVQKETDKRSDERKIANI